MFLFLNNSYVDFYFLVCYNKNVLYDNVKKMDDVISFGNIIHLNGLLLKYL